MAKMHVYQYQTGHYRHLWRGECGVIVAPNKAAAKAAITKLCGSDDVVHKLKRLNVSRPGRFKVSYEQ